MANNQLKGESKSGIIRRVLIDYGKPVTAQALWKSSKQLQQLWPDQSDDYVARTLSANWLEQRLGRMPNTDPNQQAKYVYCSVETPGAELVKETKSKKELRKRRHARRKAEQTKELPVPAKRAYHRSEPEVKPTKLQAHDDNMVIESGTTRITIESGRIIIEPRKT